MLMFMNITVMPMLVSMTWSMNMTVVPMLLRLVTVMSMTMTQSLLIPRGLVFVRRLMGRPVGRPVDRSMGRRMDIFWRLLFTGKWLRFWGWFVVTIAFQVDIAFFFYAFFSLFS